jgi:hypothetical protein
MRPPKGHPVPGSRPLTTKIRTATTLRALGVETPREQQNLTTGVASQRLRGGPLARRCKAERRHFFHLGHKRAHTASKGGRGGTEVDTVNKDNSYDDDNDNVASAGCQKTGLSPNNPANRASNRHLETRFPMVPTRSGRGATARTIDDDISSSGVLPIASDDEFASKERGHKPDVNKAAGAAAFSMRQVAELAVGELVAGARCSADSMFIQAISANDNAVAASARQPDGYARRHESVKATVAASEAWSRPRERPHSMPSGCHGLGWAGRRYKTPGG